MVVQIVLINGKNIKSKTEIKEKLKQKSNSSKREILEKKIWNDIIRNNAKRHNNMPTRRETALTSLTLKMLQDESYVYYLHADDDSDALSALEQQAIIKAKLEEQVKEALKLLLK